MRALAGLFLALLLAVPAGLAESEPWSTRSARETVFNALVDVFRRHYWDESWVDWEAWADLHREQILSAPSRSAFDRGARAMVDDLGDHHSSWLGLVAYATDTDIPATRPRLGISTRALAGVGLVVERVYPGTPAAAAGLRRGDVIVTVDGRSVLEPGGAPQGHGLLAAAARSERVLLGLQRGRLELQAEVFPAPVQLAALADLPQAEMLDDGLGYLYVPSFDGDEVGEEVHRLVAELQGQGMEALVLDLRGNLGGRLTELGLTLGVFMDGEWAQAVSRDRLIWSAHYRHGAERGRAWLEDRSGEVVLTTEIPAPTRFDGPLAVLVDSRNSSAGEVAALALQSAGRALVIGEATAGNVEAVQGFDLPDGSVVMVAVANLQGPDGSSFGGGVQPDVHARERLSELARGFDAPLAAARRNLQRLPFTPSRFFGQVDSRR